MKNCLIYVSLLIIALLACNPKPKAPPMEQALRDIDKKLGVVSRDHRNNLILTIANSGLKVGTEVAIISAPGHSFYCCAEIVKNLGQDPGLGHQIILFGHTQDTTYIMQMNKHSAAIELGFGIIDDPKIFSSKKGIMRADLNLDGVQDSFRDCTSNEGVHLTLWSGLPLKGPRLWHAYYFLEYDVVPSCQEKDYTD